MAGMKGLKKQRRLQIVLLMLVSLVISTVLIYFALGDGINYFRSPSQIVAEPPSPTEVFRIGGLVEEGTLVRGAGEVVRFSVTDGGATIPVEYTGILPDLFAENAGMVGTGTYVNGVFQASEILAKHDESYMPREVVEALEEQGVYRHTEGD